jgi:ribosome-binding factor A
VVSKVRAQRIAERIREELSEMMIHDIVDPRLEGVSITDVTVDRELAYAHIYVSSLEGSESSEGILSGFDHASGYIRSELAHRIELRTFPQLRFKWDPTYERAERIEQLIASLHENESPPEDVEDEGE